MRLRGSLIRPTPDEREASLYFLGRKREYDEAREAIIKQLGLEEADERIAAADKAANAMRKRAKDARKQMQEHGEVDAPTAAAVSAARRQLKKSKKHVQKLEDEKQGLLRNLERGMRAGFPHRTYQEECAEEIAAKLKRFM